eukprot:971860-Prorocentrum_lima.AAC.1
MEQPWSAISRALPEIQQAAKSCDEGCTYMCDFGLQCPETQLLLQKRTWLATSSPSALRALCQ